MESELGSDTGTKGHPITTAAFLFCCFVVVLVVVVVVALVDDAIARVVHVHVCVFVCIFLLWFSVVMALGESLIAASYLDGFCLTPLALSICSPARFYFHSCGRGKERSRKVNGIAALLA